MIPEPHDERADDSSYFQTAFLDQMRDDLADAWTGLEPMFYSRREARRVADDMTDAEVWIEWERLK